MGGPRAPGRHARLDGDHVTRQKYRRICQRLARKAIRFAKEHAEQDVPDNVTSEHDHWIELFLDEHLPIIDPDVLLEVTFNADAFEKSAGRPAQEREVAAIYAFQADVWDAIDQAESP